MWQLVIVFIVVGLALIILVRRLFRAVKGKEDLCSCSSGTCSRKDSKKLPVCCKADEKNAPTMSDELKLPREGS